MLQKLYLLFFTIRHIASNRIDVQHSILKPVIFKLKCQTDIYDSFEKYSREQNLFLQQLYLELILIKLNSNATNYILHN